MIDDLAAIVGAGNVLVDRDLVAGHTVDWTGRFRGHTPAVVRPGSSAEVAEIVRWCRRTGTPIVPQGGNTGLVGGGVPLSGEVVVSLRRLSAIGDVDVLAGQVTVGAGATLQSVQDAARAAGLEFAVDLGARGSATIGGMIATNAGGTRVIRHGPMRAQVLGVEAVLGDGTVVSHLQGLLKDNTGYDLAGLLCGSEGTLGIVTAARLRLVPALAERTVVLLGVDDVDAALRCVAAARATGVLDAAEVFFANGLDMVCGHAGLPRPFTPDAAAYLLLEAASDVDPTDRLLAALAAVDRDIRATAVGVTPVQRAELWRYREAHTEAINALGVPHKMDVTLPFANLQRFCDEVLDVVRARAPGAATFLFGHLGDGNVHVNVVGRDAVPDEVDGEVLHLVASLGGSISAEHGIGTAKRAVLHLSRSPEEIAAFRAVKRALDPDGILNPNVLLLPGEPPDRGGYA